MAIDGACIVLGGDVAIFDIIDVGCLVIGNGTDLLDDAMGESGCCF